MLDHWIQKFSNAFRGIRLAVVGQSSLHVHLPAAALVLFLAWQLRCNFWQWCVLGLCIALVMTMELLNTAIEYLAKGLCEEHNEHVGRALDIGSGAVLLASIAAALIGVAVFAAQIISLMK